jgi:hypothetical protein
MKPRSVVKSALMGLVALGLSVSVAVAHQFKYPVSGTITSTYNSPRSYGKHGALDIAGELDDLCSLYS